MDTSKNEEYQAEIQKFLSERTERIHENIRTYLKEKYKSFSDREIDATVQLYQGLEDKVGFDAPNYNTVDFMANQIKNMREEEVPFTGKEGTFNNDVFIPILKKTLVNLLMSAAVIYFAVSLFSNSYTWVKAAVSILIGFAFIKTEKNIIVQEGKTVLGEEQLIQENKYIVSKVNINNFIEGNEKMYCELEDGSIVDLNSFEEDADKRDYIIKPDLTDGNEFLEIQKYVTPYILVKNGKRLKGRYIIRVKYIYHLKKENLLTAKIMKDLD